MLMMQLIRKRLSSHYATQSWQDDEISKEGRNYQVQDGSAQDGSTQADLSSFMNIHNMKLVGSLPTPLKK